MNAIRMIYSPLALSALASATTLTTSASPAATATTALDSRVAPSLDSVCTADSSEHVCVPYGGRSEMNVTVDLEEKKGGAGGGGHGSGGHGGARPGAGGHSGGKGEGSLLGAGTALILGISVAAVVASMIL